MMAVMSTDAALKALAEPHRRAILRLVRDEPRSVTEIAEHFEITQQAVSLHLKVLREAGLVGVRRDGQRRLYLVDPDGMASLHEFLAEMWPAGHISARNSCSDAMPSGSTRYSRRCPSRRTPTKPASRSTLRCSETACWVISKCSAISVTDRGSSRTRRRIARRCGSARAFRAASVDITAIMPHRACFHKQPLAQATACI